MKSKSKKEDLFNIEGKVIAIIGGVGILGKQYVRYLSSLGAIIIIGDIKYSLCKKISKEINNLGHQAFPLKIDNTDESSISKFFIKITEKYGRLDVLINNAQIKPKGFYKSFEDYDKKTLETVIDGNLIGVTLACQAVSKIFLNQKEGVIVNIASVYGISAADQRIYEDVENIYSNEGSLSSPVSYAISKAGIVQLTKYLASYYREKNIRINCLTPGGVYDNHNELFVKNYSYKTLLGRMAEKNEYNGAILFLCSQASSYMNGANLIVDGGWTAI
tara:strand:+ start:378 stop:1202 length:825 start_codon:yes stop_codon:yes gene_type:complete